MSSRVYNASMHGLQVITAIALLACTGDTQAPALPSGPVGLSISPSALNLIVGDQGTLVARAFDATNRTTHATFEWSSTDSSIASVLSNFGNVSALAPGITTVIATAGTLRATATVTVRPTGPPFAIVISPSTLSLNIGIAERLTARVTDSTGRPTSASIEWSSANPAIATVGRTDGMVSAIAAGSTTVTATAGAIDATVTVSVEPGSLVAQWAMGATASSEYSAGEWSASQATGIPDVTGCADHPGAWASLERGFDWLELTYAQAVRPSEIRIHEVWGVGSIVRVEVKDLSGAYHTVYTAQPTDPRICPRILTIEVKGVMAMVSTVRVTVDQTQFHDWNEIDAVRLSGYR